MIPLTGHGYSNGSQMHQYNLARNAVRLSQRSRPRGVLVSSQSFDMLGVIAGPSAMTVLNAKSYWSSSRFCYFVKYKIPIETCIYRLICLVVLLGPRNK